MKILKITIKDKYNFIKPDGTYLSNQWFDYAGSFHDGFAKDYIEILLAMVEFIKIKFQ